MSTKTFAEATTTTTSDPMPTLFATLSSKIWCSGGGDNEGGVDDDDGGDENDVNENIYP